MRDDERIQAYYNFGTIDYHSELAKNKKNGKGVFPFSVLRALKFAVIIWVEAIKNLSSQSRITSKRRNKRM
ncbi:MAG: hypothetical protein JL50_21265 [Peptococcaceae bacterium BICA1-7]|nr:MAG: hypothetical protein JL50_21265 [Peptococcaceae bacterium BICA1-7]HBV97141.1 hypothetical protein [Desulfotomaculum sp.]